MKKLLACLLALMLLPAAAFAQGMVCEWSLDMPEDALVKLAQNIQAAFPETVEAFADVDEGMLRGLAKLLDGVAADVHVQDELAQVGLHLNDADILQATMYTDHGATCVCFDAMPGIALAMPASQTPVVTTEDMQALLLSDWASLGASIDAVVNDWLLTLPTVIETGSFAGEAYIGGLYRMSYQVDDRDLFVLMESLLHYEEQFTAIPELQTLLTAYGLDLAAVLENVRNVAYEAAKENAYTYLVHSVSDGEYLIGLSIVAYQQDKQVSTLSLGWQDEGFKAVLGYGYQGRNVYFAAESVGNLWSMQMIKDDAMNGYTAACQESQNVLLQLSGETKSNGGQMTVKANLTGELMRGLNIGTEIFVDSSLSDTEVSSKLTVNGEVLMNQMVRMDTADDKAAPDQEDLRVVELRDDGTMSENIDSELERFVTTLGIRVFKVLPVELLTTAMDMTELFQ